MTEEPGLQEQAVSEAVRLGIASQVNTAEAIEVDIKTDLVQAVQGKADAVSISGQGVVIQPEIRVEHLEVETARIDLNPLSVLLGQLELNHPIDAIARLTLTEVDLNRAANSAYIQERMSTLTLEVEGQPVQLGLQFPIAIQLPAEDQIAIQGSATLVRQEQQQSLGFSALLSPRTETEPVRLHRFECSPGTGLEFEVALALFRYCKVWLDMPHLELQGLAVRVQKLKVQPGSLSCQLEAFVRNLNLF